MTATQMFIALAAVLVGLFVVALIKPYVFKKAQISIHDLKNELTATLPHHDLMIKHGTQSRIIVSLNGIQKAIIVMDKPRADYVMGGLPIFTTNKLTDIKKIADKIGAMVVVS